jgi:hypothetical protein
LILGNAVTLLNLALELIAAASDHIEVVIRELAPLLFDLAFDLLPIAFNPVPVHSISSLFERHRDNSRVQKKFPAPELLPACSVLRALVFETREALVAFNVRREQFVAEERLTARFDAAIRDIRVMERGMGKGILLWLVGIPIPIILLLWIFGYLH